MDFGRIVIGQPVTAKHESVLIWSPRSLFHGRAFGLAVLHPEGIGIADRPADDRVTLGGALVGPDKDFLQDAEVVELVNGE